MRDISRLALRALLVVAAVAAAATAGAATKHYEHVFRATDGSTVKVDVSFHDVTVTVVPGDEVRVSVDLETKATGDSAERLFKRYEPTFTVEHDTLLIRSVTHRHWTLFSFGSSGVHGKVVVAMPPGKNLSLDTASGDCKVEGNLGDAKLSADVASGDVEVHGRARTINIDSASGDVTLELEGAVDVVSADTASGDVHVTGSVKDLKADTASGDVTATGLTGPANVDTASGDVSLEWTSIGTGTKVLVDTASGDARLVLPAGTEVAGKVTTSSGAIRSDFPGEKSGRGKTLRLSSGAAEAVHVRIDTASGDVQLRTTTP
jgi:DUF4097 and DUF4098 domain-containing protein YvlB